MLDIMPVDSYVVRYQETESKYFAGTMYEVSMVLQTFDYSEPANQDAVLKLRDDLTASPFVHGEVECWLADFLRWLPTSPINASLVGGRPSDGTRLLWLYSLDHLCDDSSFRAIVL